MGRHGRSDRSRPCARADGRRADELRPVQLERDFTEFAPGSVLVRMGRTTVLCTASFSEEPPRWMRGTGKGWVTAEYSMLPGLVARTHRPGSGQGPPVGPYPGDTAAHRAQPAGGHGPDRPGRAAGDARLRCPPGRRRHQDGQHRGRVGGPSRRLQPGWWRPAGLPRTRSKRAVRRCRSG